MTFGWLDYDLDGLKNRLVKAEPGLSVPELSKALINIKLLESQERTANALVASTDRLVCATKVLGRYTLALVGVTIVLVLVTAATLVWKG